jgi:succinoglycan biosynthesis transport protein ExoP
MNITSQKNTSSYQAILTFQDYIKVIGLRKWWFIISLILATSIAIIYSYSLPDFYRSTTLIMVERQRIPESYVQSTITSSIQDRLNTIRQQILSRTNLENIITQFALDKKSDFIPLSTQLNQRFLEFTGIDIEKLLVSSKLHKINVLASLEDTVDRMRESVEVSVVGGNNAFTISYSGRDPQTVMDVTNRLSTLFIDENLKLREQYAEGTSDFLTKELLGAKQNLEQQEKSLKEFKESHMGSLPEQLDANLRALDRLQSELQSANNDLRNTENRRLLYEEQLKEYERQLIERQLAEKEQGSAHMAPLTDVTMDAQIVGLERTLERLMDQLTSLRSQFNENYPDILSLKNQIREIEARLAKQSAGLQPMEQTSSNQPKKLAGNGLQTQPPEQRRANQTERRRVTLPPPQIIKAQLQSVHSDMELLRERQKRTAALIKEYERRIEETFANQQKLVSITRGYEMSHQNYQALLQKLLNAKVAENLERREKGERFRVVDPANLPQKPYKPNRPKLIGFGSLLGMGLGIGFIFLKEHFRPLYRKTEDVHDSINLPVLASIPTNKISKMKIHPLVTLKESDSAVTEQFRILYTKISWLNDRKPYNETKSYSVFAISSALKNEGKTITSLNLSIVAARDFGKKTLLIEADFKNPQIASYLGLKADGGLTDILLNNTDIQSCMITYGHDNLSILPVGGSMQNSSPVLSSTRMKDLISTLRERYDYIFIDCPPILSLPDMNIIERLVDGVILVIRGEKTPRNLLTMASRSLQGDKLLGLILNDVRQPSKQYRQYYAGSM